MANYYIADLHLGHENVIRFDNRPFANLEEMHRTILENWNRTVTADDTVYILGDMIWGKESEWPSWLSQFSGKKVLITGNHDPKQLSEKSKRFFREVRDYLEIADDGRRVILCHYPMPFHRAAYSERCYMLYGHVHHTREYIFLEQLRWDVKSSCTQDGFARGNFINVGCMMPWIDYTPRTLEEIIRREAEYWNLPEERLNAIEEQLRQRVGELLTLSDCEEKEELEESLPDYVHASIEQMKRSWAAIDAGKEDTSWDIYWCELQADINFAEHEQQISPDQARFLRKKYLRI